MSVVDALKPADFTTDQEVRWCPGCGDYAILKGVRKALADLGRAPHEVTFVSGIGCAARFPYYIESYGFHTIHGRAPAVATGVKLANPELDVWVVGGDGDFLSIGGNHLLHTLRRNVDLTLLLLNNAIYGLTKGQASPTSLPGTRSPSTPAGSAEQPINAVLFALGAGAKFIARTADTLQKHLPGILMEANRYKGAALVEIYQNCIVYNDDAWGGLADKKKTDDMTVKAVHGEPLLFGKDNGRGLRFNETTDSFDVIDVDDSNRDTVSIHDKTHVNRASALARLTDPVALGVLYEEPGQDYNSSLNDTVPYHRMNRDDLQTLISHGAIAMSGTRKD